MISLQIILFRLNLINMMLTVYHTINLQIQNFECQKNHHFIHVFANNFNVKIFFLYRSN